MIELVEAPSNFQYGLKGMTGRYEVVLAGDQGDTGLQDWLAEQEIAFPTAYGGRMEIRGREKQIIRLFFKLETEAVACRLRFA